MSEIVPENKMQCKICGKEFKSIAARSCHTSVHYRKEKQEIKCLECGRIFDNIRSLSIHTKTHKLSKKDYYDKYLKKDKDGVCKTCAKNTSFVSLTHGYHDYCSQQCASLGTVKQREEKSFIKYSVSNPSKCKIIKEKISSVYKNKSEIEKSNINSKREKTTKDKYGVNNVFQLEEIRDKFIKTCQQKYGVDNVFQLKEIKDKIKQLNEERYGGPSPYCSKEIQEKGKQTCFENWGVDNYSKTEQFRNLLFNQILVQKNNGERLYPKVGTFERSCLDELEFLSSFNIERSFPCIGFFIDGYIKELNIAIEFDEPAHFKNGILTNKDQDRQNKIYKKLNCAFFRVKLTEWNNIDKKRKIILDFKEMINGIQSRSESGDRLFDVMV